MTEGIIQYEDFAKVDLRVAKIMKVEEIENADKLWKLTVDLGKEFGKRTVCAGIKKYYSSNDLKNKKIILVSNLQPRILRGIESQGMILAAVNKEETKVVLISPEKDIEVGSKVR